MNNTKLTLALLAIVAGLAGASSAQAGQGSFQLGNSMFADRCLDNGGDLFDIKSGAGCDLGDVAVGCSFIGAQTWCEWDGAQNDRDVRRVLGAAVAETLAEQGPSGKKKKLLWNPNLPIINFP